MSIKVIVADDQLIIREHICKFVREADDEFEIVGSFEDGSDVIDFLRTNTADIALLDVIMCEVSGIDVAKFIYENNIKTHVIIISAYRDFDSARSAISYGVKDYLVKPTSTNELRNVLGRIKKEILRNEDGQSSLDEVTEFISKADASELETHAEAIVESIIAMQNENTNRFRANVLTLLQLIDSKFTQLDIETSFVKNVKAEYINAVWNYTDKSLIEWLKSKLKAIFSLVDSTKADKNELIISKALKFINEHYMENIYITDVANHVYLNEDYFGKLFKRNLNISFSDYITRVRIEKAIKLLETGKYKIYQIGEKVGYKSSNYFITAFKTYTGFTPKEYCQKFGVDNEQ